MSSTHPGNPQLTFAERDQWRDAGYLIRRRMFSSQEMHALSEEAWQLTARRDLIDMRNLRCRFQQTFDDSDCLWETFDPVIDLSPLCEQFALDPRVLSLLAELYGEPAHLLKDKLIFKQPGTRGYALHQDFIAWPSFPRSFVTVLIPIDAATAENGCTEVFPGLHQQGTLSPEDGDYHELEPAQMGTVSAVKLLLEPGDIAIFDGFLPHQSGPNRTDDWRRQLYLSYNAASDGGDQRDAHYREFQQFLERKYREYGRVETYFK